MNRILDTGLLFFHVPFTSYGLSVVHFIFKKGEFMSQKEIQDLLLQLHNIVKGTKKTVKEIVNERTIEPNITLLHNTPRTGKKIDVSKYYKLADLLE